MPRIKPLSLGMLRGKQQRGKLRGLDTVLLNLKKEIDKVEGRTRAGLAFGALIVKRKAIILAPIDTGNLRNSAYVISGGGLKGGKPKIKQTGSEGDFRNKSAGSDVADKMFSDHRSILAERSSVTSKYPFAEIGFTANYALMVHENLNVSHVKKSGKGKRKHLVRTGQAKFLETALLQSKRDIINQVRKRARR